MSELDLIESESDSEIVNYIDLGLLINAIETEGKCHEAVLNLSLGEKSLKQLRYTLGEHYIYSKVQKKPTDYSMQIRLVNDVPIHCAPRRLSYYERTEIQKIVDNLMERGVIRPSESPYSSAIVLVKKKNGKIRMCIDYRAINKLTIRDNFPLPLIEDCLEYFAQKKYFSTLDLKDGFHHIEMHKDSVKFTAFVTPFGQFEYVRMPFGLKNAPAVFQRYIYMKLKTLITARKIVVYLDDICIATHDLNEHLKVLTEVLQLLKEAGLELNMKKCKFAFQELDYLGYKVNENGIRPNDEHIEAIRTYPMPKNTKDIQRCIGLFSYFRRFVPNFSRMARPLTEQLKKDAKFNWTTECTAAFEYLRDQLATAPILAIYDPKKEIELHCDASSHGFGSVLMQRQEDKKFHPVAYYSKTTSPVEAKLISFELETLAIVYALKRFHTFLDRLPFTIVTDCEALAQTLKKRDLNPRIAKWALALENYAYQIQHRKGEQMAHVDALSRVAMAAAVETEGIDLNIQIAQGRDGNIRSIRERLEKEELAGYRMEDGLIFKINTQGRRQLMVPRELEENIMRLTHEKYGHFGVEKCTQQILKHYWLPNLREKLARFIKNCLKCIFYSERNLYNIPKQPEPFDTIHIDHFGPLPSLKSKDKYVFAVIDGFTKFVKLYAVNGPGTKEARVALEKYFEYYSRPRRIISDRGTAFKSNDFHGFVARLNIKHVEVATGSPQSNGQIERMNRDLKAILSKLAESGEHADWRQKLTDVECHE